MNGNGDTKTAPQHGAVLRDDHRRVLTDESAISPEVVDERGYYTAATKAELERKGFGRAQRLAPGLMMPVWGPNGEVKFHLLRPDAPRKIKGKTAKYEFPGGQRMALDVPPRCRADLGNPGVPLFVTEGLKKADAAASRGLCVVDVVGVWNWRGTNGMGGKTALPEWEMIALNGRTVYVVFDSHVMLKPEVYRALERLQAFLKYRDADVWVIYL